MDWSKFIKVLRDIRVAPGKIYVDQVSERIKLIGEPVSKSADPDKVVDTINRCLTAGKDKPEDFFRQEKVGQYFKEDPDTKEVYSVPSKRMQLDEWIKEEIKEYEYNKFLYEDYKYNESSCKKLTMQELYSTKGVFSKRKGVLTIDLTVLKEKDKTVVIDGFNLDDIYKRFNKQDEDLRIGRIQAEGIVFTGKTSLKVCDRADKVTSIKGMCFRNATFLGDVEIEDMNFTFEGRVVRDEDGYEANKIDFRNCRFMKSVCIRDIRLSGDMPDIEISFEDVRISGDFEILNAELGHIKLNCFQMIVGDFIQYVEKIDESQSHKISLINIDFEDGSYIDFQDAESFQGDFLFENINNLPAANLSLAPMIKQSDIMHNLCPDNHLAIRHCEINGTIYVGNVSELSFDNSRNCGQMIIEAANWGEVEEDKKKKISYRDKSRGVKGMVITNSLLLAVYNRKCSEDDNKKLDDYCVKGSDFIMLKEMFCSRGKYDEEDEAFILYMEYKPYIDGKRKGKNRKDWLNECIYKFLFMTGRYGISPQRTLVSLFIQVVIFAILYLVVYLMTGTDVISTGEVHVYADNSIARATVSSILYSIASIIPIVSQFEPLNLGVCIISIVEGFIGFFIMGYFSVAVVRKTLR